MTNYSRTTLRELKKRYLNVLKKCLLLNLMVFSLGTFSTTAIATEDRLVLSSGESKTYTQNVTFKEFSGYSNGGAIHNSSGTVTFDELATFVSNEAEVGGAIHNSSGKKNDDGTIVYGMILGKSIFLNNTAIGSAGAIYNAGYINFTDEVLFEGNTGQSRFGGAIWNSGVINFSKEDTLKFIGNSSKNGGGAIYNYTGGIINFNGTTIFEKNFSNVLTGAIHASFSKGALNFNGTTIFKNNNGLWAGAVGMAGSLESKANFNAPVFFINNYAKDGAGGIRSTVSVVFNSDFTFASNYGNLGNDMFNDRIMYISPTEDKIGTIEGGILNTGRIYKGGLGIFILGDQSINKGIYESRQGKFIQTAGLTIAGSHNLVLAESHTINGGELKTHGTEIGYKAVVGQNVDENGAVLSAGKVMHYTTKPEMEVNGETLANLTFAGEDLGATIGVGSYTKTEQEKEIALVGDRLIEYLDDKGTEDTSDDEMVRYQATDKLFTIDTLPTGTLTKFKVTGALPNEKGNTIAFRNGRVEIDPTIGNTGATYELENSILESIQVQNKVRSKGMILGEAKEYTFTDLEIAPESTLDIKNKKVIADTLTMTKNSVLNIDLNSITDHGKMSIGEVEGEDKGILSLKLTKGLDQENGIYQVFDKDNDLKLQENKLFKITDLENGAFEVAKKRQEDLINDFEMSSEQAIAATAFIEGNSSNETFTRMQEEILDALQSEDNGTVKKAKKALKAVGAKEHPVEQSVASEHLVALQNVVQAELNGTTVGHSGGDTNPRAKVYIKGLYDRTKSSMGEGFRARSKGAVLGVQSEVTDTLTLGVGYATSQTTAKEDLRRTEVDTNTGFISAHYQPNAWWVSGLATFSRGEYEEEKQILSSMGKATYDVDSWGAQVITGYDIKLENAIITPEVGMRYLSVKQEGYTDTLGTTVSGTQSDYLTALVGVKGTWDMGAIRPIAGVTVGYDIISDDVSALNTLANGASYTVNGEALDRLSTGVSLGVEADIGERTTLKLEYNGNYRKEYLDHSGMLRLEWRF